MSDTDYVYSVSPPTKRFSTRHEAVGFLAVHSRKYNYHPPADYRIEAYEKRSVGTETDRHPRPDD